MDRRQFLQTTGASALAVAAPDLDWAQTPRPTLLPAERAALPRPAAGPIKVACAISRNTTKIDYVGPEAVFETWFPREGSTRPEKHFEIFTVAESMEPTSGIAPNYTFTTAPAAHIVVVPAQIGSPALHEWLRSVHKSSDVTMSVCTGARHLALAGLLDGRPATTHHKSIDGFGKEFPAVNWVRSVRFVEGDRLATSGGLTAGIDLALRIVERYFSREQARFVATHLEYDGQRWMV
jgi:transcriptional regulator GlxA family with amidase domain